MIIIIGLGNPGQKYTYTRHNIGFRVVDEFAKENNFPEFRLSKKFNALISEKDNIVLTKPQTFMNESGKAVKRITMNYPPTGDLPKGDKLSPYEGSPEGRQTIPLRGISRRETNFIIIHDDIDLPLGKIKISKNRGSAGHKGVESVIRDLGTKDFIRFRIGIQPKTDKPKNVETFVLQKFDKEEEKIIEEVIKETLEKLKKRKTYGFNYC